MNPILVNQKEYNQLEELLSSSQWLQFVKELKETVDISLKQAKEIADKINAFDLERSMKKVFRIREEKDEDLILTSNPVHDYPYLCVIDGVIGYAMERKNEFYFFYTSKTLAQDFRKITVEELRDAKAISY